MTAVEQRPTVASWNEPANVAARGTLIVLPGRGEHPALYERFGRRLSVDAWRVRVVEDPARDEPAAQRQVQQVLAEIAASSEAEQSGGPSGPVVLVGSDAGALYAAVLAAEDVAVDALVLAGVALPGTSAGDGPSDHDATDWAGEIELRTACSAHQSRLRNDGDVRRGAIFTAVPPAWLDRARLGEVTVPVLALHGLTDEISPIESARHFYAAAPRVELYGVQGGRHDVLNDQTHRSVAATIVLFLERLRLQLSPGSAATADAPPEIVTRLVRP